MGLLNGFQGKIDSAQNFIKNPFSSAVEVPFDGNDFPGGFYIEEILESGDIGEQVRLFGNMMPKIPFTFGGGQRIKKDFYPGYSEPVVQVLGSEEDDITITGEFKDKGYKRDLKGVSSDIAELIDVIRIRGNVVRIALGEFERFAIITKTKWDMDKLSKIQYAITFSVIGFEKPTNARFLQDTREIPFNINRALIAQAEEFQQFNDNIPDSVPRSIADQINGLTSAVAGAVATVTGFVDGVLSTVNDIQKSVTRAKGLLKYAQNKVRNYKNVVGSFKPFDDQQALTGKYQSAKFYSSAISRAAAMTALLERLREQIAKLTPQVPIGRHVIISGDNLQKISLKFYGSPDHWKRIYDFNRLGSTDLVVGQLLEIPKL